MYKLESVSWRRPGVMDVTITALIKINSKIPATPTSSGLAGYYGELVERRIERVGGADKVTWLFRSGYRSSELGASSDGDEFWSMEVSLMQEPITCHPNLDKILKAGQGVLKKGEIDWPRYIGDKKNSWYGVNSFLFPSIVVSCEKIKKKGGNFSFTDIDDVGFSKSSLPGGFNYGGSAGKNRKKWLLESHQLSRVGSDFRERKSWRWGGVLGWIDQLYDKGWGK